MTNQDAEVFLIVLRPSRHQLIHGGFGPDFQSSLPAKQPFMKLLSNMAERRICPEVDNLVRIVRKIEELWPEFLMQHVFPGGGSDDPCTTVIGVHLKALTGSTAAKINFTDRKFAPRQGRIRVMQQRKQRATFEVSYGERASGAFDESGDQIDRFHQMILRKAAGGVGLG